MAVFACFHCKRTLRALLSLAAAGLCLVGVHWFCLRSAAGHVTEAPVQLPVLMYHSIYTAVPSEYAVTTDQLESDLVWLKQHGYTAVTGEMLCDYTDGKGSLPAHPVLITLDDGFYNNYSELLPLLQTYDMHAIVSVVGSYTDMQAEKDAHNPNFSYLTWEEMRLLHESGRVEIGNHTYGMHTFGKGRNGCAKRPEETAEQYTAALSADIGTLQTALHRQTGMQPFIFAYPFGAVSRESIPVLREAGFRITLTCREIINTITRDPACLYGLGRFNRSGFYSTEQYMQIVFHDSCNKNAP